MQQNWAFRGLVPYNDQNATGNDRADEDKPFSITATKGGITDIQEHNFHQPSDSRGRTGHIPAKNVKPESQATAKHKWHWLTFDLNTIKLPDFLEVLNQGAKKAFGENAKSRIDSLLYAKLSPKLKRSVNKARLENGKPGEIVAHFERELELNALEESGGLPMATMASASTNNNNLLSNGINTKRTLQSYRPTTIKAATNSKRKRNWRIKTARSPSVKLTQNAKLAGKRTTPLNGVGMEQGYSYVSKGRTRMTRPMIPLRRKRHPRSQVP